MPVVEFGKSQIGGARGNVAAECQRKRVGRAKIQVKIVKVGAWVELQVVAIKFELIVSGKFKILIRYLVECRFILAVCQSTIYIFCFAGL